MVSIVEAKALKARVRWAVGTVAIVVLSACFGDATSNNMRKSPLFSKQAPSAPEKLVRKRLVMSKSVTVAAPKGYCIDESSLRDEAAGAFVPLGACAALTRNPADPSPKIPTLLVVSVSPLPAAVAAIADDPNALMQQATTFLKSNAGRAALSRSGDASTVKVLDLKAGSGMVKVLTRDSSDNRPASLSDTTWRAFVPLGDTLIVASVTGFSKTPLDARKGLAELDKLVSEIRQANRVKNGSGGGIASLFDKLRNE